MPPTIALAFTAGHLAGQRFTYAERTTCIVGRAAGCDLRIPAEGTDQKRTVSRHHCLLDINPPDIRIRDFGSRNGTYINGELIGKRAPDKSPDEASRSDCPLRDLRDGDEVRLGKTRFRVEIHIPVYCIQCSEEIEIPEDGAGASAAITCQACGHVIRPARIAPPRQCSRCGRVVTDEVGSRQGEYVCALCRADPFHIMDQMLQSASRGDRQLVAIDGYEVLREIGRGGMGAVYLARHRTTGRELAMKILLPQVAAAQNAIERFLREAAFSRALEHPNIVRLFDSGCNRGTFFLTMEYCNGGSVDKLLRTIGRRMTPAEAVPIILQVLDALDFAHGAEIKVKTKKGKDLKSRGLVHRDMKPANILLARTPSGLTAKIGDYGLAKAFDLAGLSGHTCAGTVGGTAQFMPRQQVLRFKFAKPEVDVWATAASLYGMLTAKYPRRFPKDEDPWQVVLETNPVPIRQRAPQVPEKLARVIDEALIDNPEIRIKSARELKERLEEACR